MDNSQDNNKEWWEEDYIILNGGILIKRGRITPGSLIGYGDEYRKQILTKAIKKIKDK